MATQYSAELQAAEAGQRQHASKWGGEVRRREFNVTTIAGVADDTIGLIKLEAGPVNVVGIVLIDGWSAFGTSRTMNLGHEAYADVDENVQAENLTAFDSARSVASAGSAEIWLNKPFSIKGTFTIVAQIQGGTIPAAATLKGYVLYVAN